ncbi:MAG: BatA and WFA domain-containing protein [Elusimicrobia bacterium]|nr:BatA and WFA domain-containing protein [Elusimicrobiota bacterium]
MFFLNPIFLIGLLAASIPIIIHLLSKKKQRNINFGDLRFLKLAASRTIRIFRIKQYLLLLIRCLLIVILTLIFARPVMHYVSSSENSETILLIDNSYSMDYYKDGKTRLETAKMVAGQVLDMLRPEEKISIFTFSDSISPIVKNPTTDKQILLSELTNVKITYRKTNTISAINEISKYFQNKQSEKRIILISDFSENGWSEKNYVLDGNYKVICIDIGDNSPENFAVSDVKNDGNDISIMVSNYSDNKKKIYGDIYIDDKKYKSLFFEPLSRKDDTMVISMKNISSGIHKCFMELEPDKLLPDNKHYFAFNFHEKPKVLMVDGNPQFSDFKGEVFFLKTALASNTSAKVINYIQLDDEQIDNYDMIFLCNISDFSRNSIVKLNDFILKGKSIVFFLGDNIKIENYNTTLSFLLPCELSAVVSGGELSDFGPFQNSEILKNIIISKRFLSIPKNGSEVILKFSDNTPFLMKGTNNVFVFTVSSNLSYSDMPVKPIFPVIIKQLFTYITKDEALIQTSVIGEKYLSKSEKTISGIITPSGKNIKGYIDTAFEEPGVYEIKYKNNKSEFLAVNLDVSSGESDLIKVNVSKIKKIVNKMFIGIITADAHLKKNLKSILYGNEITKYFIWALLVFAILETILANLRKV